MTKQMFLEPRPYFIRNEHEVAQLQQEAGELRKVVESGKANWVDRTRAVARLKDVERQIQTSRMAQRQQEAQQARQQGVGLCRSDDGGAFLSRSVDEPQFMPITPYWQKEDQRPEQMVSNVGGSSWWEQTERVINELRKREAAAA